MTGKHDRTRPFGEDSYNTTLWSEESRTRSVKENSKKEAVAREVRSDNYKLWLEKRGRTKPFGGNFNVYNRLFGRKSGFGQGQQRKPHGTA